MRAMIEGAVAGRTGIRVEIKRILLANALKPLPGNAKLVAALQSTVNASWVSRFRRLVCRFTPMPVSTAKQGFRWCFMALAAHGAGIQRKTCR